MRVRDLNSDESKCRAYCAHYQNGGSIPVYHGTPYQYGNGFGSSLAGFFRKVIPIIAPVAGLTAARFAAETIGGMKKGRKLKDAAKIALKPAGETLLHGALGLLNPPTQLGKGKKRKTQGVYKGVKKPKQSPKKKIIKKKKNIPKQKYSNF